MHCHGRFSGTRHALNNDVRPRRAADDDILLLLDCRNDLSQYRFLVFCEVLCQKFIIGDDIRVEEILQHILFDLVRPLAHQIHLIGSLGAYRISAGSHAALVIYRCNGRSPVQHHRLGTVLCNSDSSDIAGLLLSGDAIFKIDSPEVGLFSRLLIADQIVFIFL